ncbi:hypothetical protein [Streptomyces sp. NBC_00691]|uniref:hypothetical protein n=1 Tax=Streptomyces sp. NBC_00691 TaxID=2903671 RepID=UPI002E2EDAE3|nr:hypothetical protein [Streptomyces sp. NBC_00691]
MLEGIVGGLVGALVALLGTWITIRETRRGRVTASEEKASEQLFELLKRLRQDPESLRDVRALEDFEETYRAAVFAFRDPKVRNRLTQSLTAILQGRHLAFTPEMRYHLADLDRVMARDIRQTLTVRLDGKRLPKPEEDWVRATTDVVDYLEKWAAAMEAAELQAEEERERLDRAPGEFW